MTLNRWAGLVAPVVACGITESDTVEEVFGCLCLSAIQSRTEGAAAKHRIAIRLHRSEAWLQLQQGLSETDVGAHDNGQIFVVGTIDGMRHVGVRGTQNFRRRGDGYLLGDLPEFENDILP